MISWNTNFRDEKSTMKTRFILLIILIGLILSSLVSENVSADVSAQVAGESHWGIGFLGTFVLPIDVSTLGYRLGWSYELPSYAVEVEGRIVSGKNEIHEFGSADFHETREFGFATFSVGGIYFFGKRSISAYLGGGLTAARMWWERRTLGHAHPGWKEHEHGVSASGRGIAVYAVAGIQLLRTTRNRLKLELRADKPFFNLQGASDVFFHVMPITIGLSFSRHY